MIVLGIDPGSRNTGYGLVRCEGGGEKLLACGVLRLDGHDSHAARLKQIYDRLDEVLDTYPPDECAVEMPVYGNNPQSMLKLGRAQAAAMLAVLNRDLPVTQYTPKEVKKAVTGKGNAAKRQVLYMVCEILSIDRERTHVSLDTADALAVALCHSHRFASPGVPARFNGWAAFTRANPDRVR